MANVFVVADHKDGELKRVTLEILGELQKQNIEPTIILLGTPGSLDTLAAKLGAHGASKVAILEHAGFSKYSNEANTNAVHTYLKDKAPTAILTSSSYQGKEMLPRLAARFGVGVASDCTAFTVNASSCTLRRPIYAGKCSKQVDLLKTPGIFTVRPNIFPPALQNAKTPAIEKLAADIGSPKAKLLEEQKSQVKKVELTEADIIISGGRSLKNAENFKILRDCAEKMGAAVGASRAAVDAGYAPHDMQVGQTGKTVSPKLYIACGISGAIQHLAGMRTSKVIVAINTAADAPIFQKADYGIVGDLFEIVPLLTQELSKRS